MKITTTFGNPESDPGQWVLFQAHPDEVKKVKGFIAEDRETDIEPEEFPLSVFLKIRPVPLLVEERIQRRTNDKTTLKFSGRGRKGFDASIDMDSQRNLEQNVLRAVHSLVDTRNAEVEVADEGAARDWTQALGEPVSPGHLLPVDGKLIQDVAKRLFVTLDDGVLLFIREASDRMKVAVFDREEKLSGN